MDVVAAVNKITKHTLTRNAGNLLYEHVRKFLDSHPDISKIIFDFQNIEDVSTSFIQSTVVRLSNENIDVKLIHFNQTVQMKINTLIKISRIDPTLFKKADRLPSSPTYI